MYKEKKYNYGMNSSANTEDCKILKKIHGLIDHKMTIIEIMWLFIL